MLLGTAPVSVSQRRNSCGCLSVVAGANDAHDWAAPRRVPDDAPTREALIDVQPDRAAVPVRRGGYRTKRQGARERRSKSKPAVAETPVPEAAAVEAPAMETATMEATAMETTDARICGTRSGDR